MANTLTVARQTGRCELWTPWGTQAASPKDPKLASLRHTLKKLGKRRGAARNAGQLDEAYATKPECSYDP